VVAFKESSFVVSGIGVFVAGSIVGNACLDVVLRIVD
jgi:hypothetical protein